MRALCLLVFFWLSFGLNHEIKAQPLKAEQPKIGLVLSGGGAKGLAHIGVLKVLEEAGIHPDYIAGTSMGGIVGGLYSIGYSADSLEKIAKSMKWSYFLSDDIPRRAITIEEKEDLDRFVLSFPITEKRIKLPGGVINGQNIENLFNQLCFPVYGKRNFSEFPIPFLCNATDIETGKEVVFREGYLSDALRATMSIPSIFDPIELDGKLLVDGGLVNNLPANLLKDMGADIIIGVDVGFQAYNKIQLNSMFRIIEQALFFYGNINTTANRKLCNIIILPSLQNYNAGSFNAVDTIIAIGEASARKKFIEIKQLADSINAFNGNFRVKQENATSDSIYLTEILVEGMYRVSSDLIIGKLELPLLAKVSSQDISRAVDRLYSSLYFKKVSYHLENTGEGNGVRLALKVIEVSGGVLRIGLHYNSDSKSSILLNTSFRNLLLPGSKLAIDGVVGENPFFKTEFFKNNGWKPGFGIAFQSSRSEGYLYNIDRRISSLNFYETKLQFYSQSVFRNFCSIGAGIEFENSHIRPIINPIETLPESRYNLINYYGFLKIDNFDNAFYPTRGVKMNSGLKIVSSPQITPLTIFHTKFTNAQSLSHRMTLLNHVYAGFIEGDSIPPQFYFFSGGQLDSFHDGVMPFSGIEYMEIASKNLLVLKFDLQYRVFDKIFLTGTFNAGNFKNNFNHLLKIDAIKSGYGITAGYLTMAGPIELSYSRSGNNKGHEIFFRIGYWF